jgi:LacI family transcriptional regulator
VPPRSDRATLATVAASAGVSVSTVSKVLNGRRDVSPATRALVQSVLRQHEYVPTSTRSGEPVGNRPIELVFEGCLKAYDIEVLQGVMDGGAEAGVAVVVSVRPGAGLAPDRPSSWVRDLVAAGRQGVIAVTDALTTSHLSALARVHLPVVVIDPLHLPRSRVTSVGSTNFAGGLAATQHLLGLGHRRIAYVGGWAAASCNQARMHGYLAAMESGRAPVLDDYVRSGHFTYEDGLASGTALLRLPQTPTAVFAGSDAGALGVMEAARVRGLRIPDDLSLVGFDDTQLARMASPALTTVRQPLRDMGRVALRTVLRLAAAEQLDSHHVELATELVVRDSTAALVTAGRSQASS